MNTMKSVQKGYGESTVIDLVPLQYYRSRFVLEAAAATKMCI